MTYQDSDSMRRRSQLHRVIVHRDKFAELLETLPRGAAGISEWLHEELAGMEKDPAVQERDEGDAVLVKRALAVLVAEAAGETPSGRRVPRRPQLDPRILDVITLLERACDERISPAFAARIADMSVTHFLRLFRKGMGMTFRTFIERLRVHVAATILLEEPFGKVIHIAPRAGPWDLRTFERAFKRVMGCTPRQYRARHGSSEKT